jgi:gluconokinase
VSRANGQSDVVIGVDIGTTNAKSAAFDGRGEVLAEAEVEYPLHSPQPDRAEQDPDQVRDAVLHTLALVARALAERRIEVAGVAFSSAMHSLIGLDEAGRPLTPLVTFADNRAAAQVERIKREHDGLAIYHRTGTPIHAMSPLAKLLWFAECEPHTFGAVRSWVSVKEYVLLHLYGELMVDHSVAGATGLLNLERLDWDDDALALAGIPRGRLSRLVGTDHLCGPLRAGVARDLGLDRNVPVVIGASDGVLANVGVGAIRPETVACTIGTSGAVRVVLPEPRTDPAGRLFCYPLSAGRWVVGGATNNGGIVLRWVRDELFPDLSEIAAGSGRDPYEEIVALAEGVPAGSDGLIMLPYLSGERAPHWSSLPRGVLFGLRRSHGRGHIVRSVLEGIVYQLHAVVASLEEFGVRPQRFRAAGGFANSPLWRQIMADIFDRPIEIPDRWEGSLLGAAMHGRVVLGLAASLEEAVKVVRIGIVEEPIVEHAEAYRRIYPIFERLYDRLLPEFSALAALDEPRRPS